jgi:hypothetical protein
MRKQDYALLAGIIRDEIELTSNIRDCNISSVVNSILRIVAYRFAQKANVDMKAFLKACNSD